MNTNDPGKAAAHDPNLGDTWSLDTAGLWTESWELFKRNVGVLCACSMMSVAATLLCLGSAWMLNRSLIVGSVLGGLIASPLHAGLLTMGVAIARGGKPTVADVFIGFQRYPTLLAVIVVSGALMMLAESPTFLLNSLAGAHPSVGLACFCTAVNLCLVLPLSFFLGVRLWFAPVMCLDRTIGHPGAGLSLGTSWAVTGRSFWPLLGVWILSGLIDLGGILLLGAGLVLLAMPLTTCAFGVAYTRIMDSVSRARCPDCGCDISASPNLLCPVCGVKPPGSGSPHM